MPTDAQRTHLLEIVKARGVDLATVSKAIGKNHAYLQQFVKRGTPRHLPESVRAALGEYFGRDPDDFRSGDGRTSGRASGINKNSFGVVRIAEVNVRAASGAGRADVWGEKLGEWQLPRDLLKSATNSPLEQIKIITIVGNSMQPSLAPLERVLVDTGDIHPSPPGIFVLWDGLGLVAKRVSYVPHSEPPAVLITSDNPKYQSYERILTEAYIQGRVFGKWLWI